MPEISGVHIGAPLGAVAPSGANRLWDDGRPEFYAPASDTRLASVRIGTRASGQPTPEAFAPRAGRRAGAFSDDFYHRIYLQPERLDFGNVVTQTTRSVEVWNAYPQAVTIDALDGDLEGLAVGFLPPKRLRALEWVAYPVTATLDGASFVDTLLTLHFSLGGTRTVAISYGRVLVFAFAPNWASGFTERLEWATDLLTLRDGAEQRVRLRTWPRRALAFEVWEHGADYGHLDLLLAAWQSRAYAVPLWPDKAVLPAPLAAGTREVVVDTAHRDYHTGGLAVIGSGARRTEAVEIETVAADRLTLRRPVAADWPAGSWIVPARLGRLGARQSVTRPTAAFSHARMVFQLDDLATTTAPVASPTYRGYEVLVRRPDRSEDVSAQYQRLVDLFDNDTGVPAVTDIPNRPFVVRGFQFLLTDRAEIAAMRAWLDARAGRQVPFWMPTWERNLEVAAPIAIDEIAVLVKDRGFATYFQGLPGRQDVAFLHRDGTWYFRHIQAFEYAGGVVERLVLDEALGRACQPEDFALVCFLELARLEADAVELFFETDSVARVSLAVRSISQ